MKISEAFELYKAVIVFKHQSLKTEENYCSACNSIISILGDIDLAELNLNIIRQWSLKKSKNCTGSTIRNYIICLRQVLREAKSQGADCLDYRDIDIPKRPDSKPDYLTEEEVNELFNCIKKKKGMACKYILRNRLIVALLYSTGLRVSELIKLDRDDTEGDTITTIGKGGKAGLVFIDKRSRGCIDAYLACRTDSNPALMLGANGKRMTTGDVRSMFRRMSLPSKPNKRLHPHILRHSFATSLLKHNCNPYTLMRLMRHSDFNTTKMYLHIEDPELREAYNKYHNQ